MAVFLHSVLAKSLKALAGTLTKCTLCESAVQRGRGGAAQEHPGTD